eukprot:CAMPEP_0168342134 /NCGR_PEP_ID=MMETSP0213-20121227/15171_1 /TAXON_ID=151035 /ORGANISM="Euplotes harpa, Strain FSP1.4" /LENGTH=107 /DNA_ID=CAMNT_0008348889 /DNA_START=413 /DNA_END=736 /DNA_ORIENTATION=-
MLRHERQCNVHKKGNDDSSEDSDNGEKVAFDEPYSIEDAESEECDEDDNEFENQNKGSIREESKLNHDIPNAESDGDEEDDDEEDSDQDDLSKSSFKPKPKNNLMTS